MAPAQAVHILSMMEKEVSTRESEVETLRGKVDTLNVRASKQTDEQETEVPNLSDQLQDARSEVVSDFCDQKSHFRSYSFD